ncbi:uncharacterized protein BDZ99DRAFT_79779 [Mytilinidion resinicola]|uniref:BZIP domain-containing protein n=1 Tax=Mytilinidion resinicola TaxID=574789 RepID=A0A6A6YHC7_9PEZI|nr:uncharacterized protein BDZ99DRAFT_79779 [Mytilinidion resinicola]KAF2807415.1 hypothetical protein BDZ99DRAFT_79779 [Mytilinidion resinicola]
MAMAFPTSDEWTMGPFDSPFDMYADKHSSLLVNGQFTPQYTPHSDHQSPGHHSDRSDSLPLEQMSGYWDIPGSRHDSMGTMDPSTCQASPERIPTQDKTPSTSAALPSAPAHSSQQDTKPATRPRKRAATVKTESTAPTLRRDRKQSSRIEIDGEETPANDNFPAVPSRSLSTVFQAIDSAAQSPPSLRRKGSKGKRSKGPQSQEIKLEMNRLAAQKCREKKKRQHQTLQTTFEALATEQRDLDNTTRSLQNYIINLKNEILRHANCGDPNVDNYLRYAAGALQFNNMPAAQQMHPHMGQPNGQLNMQIDQQMDDPMKTEAQEWNEDDFRGLLQDNMAGPEFDNSLSAESTPHANGSPSFMGS